MDFSLAADQRQLAADVRDFLDEERDSFTPTCDAWITGYDPEFTAKLAKRGLIGLTWPADVGGGGRGFVDRLVAVEPLLAAGAPLAAHWFADRQMGPSVLRYGTDTQKERYLPAILRGESTWCIGMSEPEAGSDLANVRTSARREGDVFRVRGHKIWTSLAHHSEYVYLLARTDPESTRHAGLSELIVRLDAPGITITPIHDMSGAHHFNEIFFDDVEVGADTLIGEEGKGFYQITAQLGFERAGLERVMSLWPLLVEMREVADSVERRRELGRLEAGIAAARQMIYRVAWAADQGKVPDHEAAMAKAFGNRLEQDTVELASRWAGRAARLAAGSGAPYQGHVALAWRIAPSFSIRGGTTEILRGIIARRALGLDS